MILYTGRKCKVIGIVTGIITMLFNWTMLRFVGEDGGAAVTIIMYVLMFASGMFTALSNGVVSTVLAFSRSFVFMLITMAVLPLLFGINGVWLATPAAELMALALPAFMFRKYRKRYGY